jgi:hypothetical protein
VRSLRLDAIDANLAPDRRFIDCCVFDLLRRKEFHNWQTIRSKPASRTTNEPGSFYCRACRLMTGFGNTMA